MFFTVTRPLMLPAVTSPSAMPDSTRSPDTLLASSSFGASVAATSPLTVSMRTEPRTPVTFTEPETECSSTAAAAGTLTV